MTTTSKKLVPNKRFPEFENSGEWEEKKLGAIGEIITGKTPSTSNKELWKNEILFVTPSDIKENKYQTKTERMVTNINIKLLPIGSIMFSCIATIGKMAIAQEVCTTNQQINSIIVDKEKAYNEFIYYSLQSIIAKIKAKYEKDAFSIINKTEFSNIIIHVSPLNTEQQKIADFLSSVDELIELEQQKLEKLKEYKKGLLQSIFGSNGQDKCIIDRFNCSSDILKNLSVIIMGASPAKEKANTESGIEFHQGKSFFDYLYIKDSKKYTTDYSKQINEDYIIMSVRAPVGEINLTDREIALGRGLCGIKPFKVNKLYLYYYLLYFKNLINYNAKGLVFDSITKSDVENIYIKFPPDTIQENIGNTLFFIDKIIIEQISKVKKIQEYKKGLLQQLFPN